ncbi:MAG: succinate dehydrogenase, cytochrome b556 subunit [Alphaproteobacteria bacterium]
MTIKVKYTPAEQHNQQTKTDNQNPSKTDENRPTSPHIQIYKWEWTMAYSILHRISAIGVGVIALIFTLSFYVVPEYFDVIHLINEFLIFKLAYFIALLVIGYYIFATIKYMIWSRVKGLELAPAQKLGHASLIATIIFAIGVFCYGVI